MAELFSVAEYADFSLPEAFIFSTKSALNTVNNTLCTRE